MHKFPTRYTRIATEAANIVSTLWAEDKLSSRTVRYHLRKMLIEKGITPKLDSGAFRTTILLPKGVIKVPHTEDAIKSTITEARLFDVVKKNKNIAQHFPESYLVHAYGFPVLLQERVPNVATQNIPKTHPMYNSPRIDEQNPIHQAVDEFGQRLGLGDIHMGNYGWKYDNYGAYPVFFDCELSPDMQDFTPKQVKKVAARTAEWEYPV